MTTHFHLVGRLPKRFADGNENDDLHPTTTFRAVLWFKRLSCKKSYVSLY